MRVWSSLIPQRDQFKMKASSSLSTSPEPRSQGVVSWYEVCANCTSICAELAPRMSRADVRSIQAEVQAAAHRDADFGEDSSRVAQHRARLDADLAGMQPLEKLFQEIRSSLLSGGPMPDVDFDKLASTVGPRYGYSTPREAFRPVRYTTFNDWFLRSLAPDTLQRCQENATRADVCAPVQAVCTEQPLTGRMTLKVSVIAVRDLLRLVRGDALVQFALRKTDYHRVHSPVDGRVESIVAYEKDRLFPGSEAMTIIRIEAERLGVVQVLAIGEWSVQSFAPAVSVGARVQKVDELGHFHFGSQVILVLPAGALPLSVRGGQRVFPGDPVGGERA